MTTRLDPFETALLAELRTHVAERAPRRRPLRRWAAGAVAAAAAGGAVAVSGLVGGLGAGPAYAVQETADGDVVVTIHRLEDAEGLEAALAEHGVDADVSYDPGDGSATAGAGVRVDGGADPEVEPPSDTAPDPEGCREPGVVATLRHDGDVWVLTIPAGSPLLDRPVQILTDVHGTLGAFYEVGIPGVVCGIVATS